MHVSSTADEEDIPQCHHGHPSEPRSPEGVRLPCELTLVPGHPRVLHLGGLSVLLAAAGPVRRGLPPLGTPSLLESAVALRVFLDTLGVTPMQV